MKKPFFVIICFLSVIVAQARTITVDDDGPADFNNIQAAIDDANDGDVVEVQPGVYTGTGNRDLDFGGKAITVQSTNPNEPCVVAATIVDCNGGWLDGHRGFYFRNGEDTNSALDGLTITNGLAWNENGGGILCQNSSPTIHNCIIKDNSAQVHMIGGGSGGGICCEEASPKIIDCTITNNTCDFGGGGIVIYSGAPTVSNCIISENAANYGGGISCWADGSVITNCAITGNQVRMEGAGLLFREGSNASIYNCIIKKNSARQEFAISRGGGIACDGSSPTIRNCLIASCSAGATTSGGGGIGGGICCADNSNPAISNCTIVYNHVIGLGRGGGIYCYWSDPNIINSILWANTTDWTGPQIALRAGASWPSTLTASYCNVQGGQAEAYVEDGCSLNWLSGNIVDDPFFADPCNGDYHLKSQSGRWDPNSEGWLQDAVTSPCIDAGNPGCPLGEEPNDANNVRINMGAYGGTAQASKSPANWRSIADLTNDWVVDFIDLAVFVNYWLDSGHYVPSDLDRNGFVDIFDLAIFANNWCW